MVNQVGFSLINNFQKGESCRLRPAGWQLIGRAYGRVGACDGERSSGRSTRCFSRAEMEEKKVDS